MGFLQDVAHWFNDPAHWKGTNGIPNRLLEHLQYSIVAIVAAVILAMPLAVWLGHTRRYGTLAVSVSNLGRAVPSFAVLVIGTQMLGLLEYPVIGSVTTFIALVLLAYPPLFTNSYVGVAEVDDDVRDSARGMGLSELQILRRVEIPMASPLLMAGLRTASLQVVATATIAAFVGAGGLGRYIIDGRAVFDNTEIFAGAVLVALLSLVTELVLSGCQRLVTPRGLRSELATAKGAAVTQLPTTSNVKVNA